MCKELSGLSLQQLENGLVDQAIIKAVEKGMVEFLSAILSACPELVCTAMTDSNCDAPKSDKVGPTSGIYWVKVDFINNCKEPQL